MFNAIRDCFYTQPSAHGDPRTCYTLSEHVNHCWNTITACLPEQCYDHCRNYCYPSLSTAFDMVPKFFLAGAGWQTAAVIAGKILPAYGTASLGQRTAFAFITGFGGAVGVCGGNMISHAIKWAISNYLSNEPPRAEDNYWRKALTDSLMYGLATFVADSIWQPLVTALSSCAFASVWGTGMICGIAFLLTICLVRKFILPHLSHFQGSADSDSVYEVIGDNNDKSLFNRTLSSDLVSSLWNAFWSASFFVFTSIATTTPIVASSPFFINGSDSAIQGIFKAGQATLAGYGISQVIEIFIKWVLYNLHLMTGDGYLKALPWRGHISRQPT